MIMLFRIHIRHFISHPLRVFRIICFKNCMDLIFLSWNSAWSVFFRSLCLCWTYSFMPAKCLGIIFPLSHWIFPSLFFSSITFCGQAQNYLPVLFGQVPKALPKYFLLHLLLAQQKMPQSLMALVFTGSLIFFPCFDSNLY